MNVQKIKTQSNTDNAKTEPIGYEQNEHDKRAAPNSTTLLKKSEL